MMLVLIFAIIHFAMGSNMTSLWTQVIKMDQVILSVQYNGRHLYVWREDAHGYSRFYVTPLVTFETDSISCELDDYSNQHQYVFSFYVHLWDSLAAETVQLALKQKGIEAQTSDIIPLPMQVVRLSVNRDDLTSNIKIDNKWRPSQDLAMDILFELHTKSKAFCEKMIGDAKNKAETFLARTKLFFEFTMLAGQKTSRAINITGTSLFKSDFFAKLHTDYSDKEGRVYLNSDDANHLARDIYQSYDINEESDEGYIPSEDESQIIQELFNIVKQNHINSEKLTEKEWDSVFWDDIYARPDIITEYFNQSIIYDEKEGHFKYDEAKDEQFRKDIENRYKTENSNTINGGLGFSFAGFGANIKGGSTDSRSDETQNIENNATRNTTFISRDELEKFINDNNAQVKWSGEKFEPKNLKLYQVNTKNLQLSNKIVYKKVINTQLASSQKLQIRPQVQISHTPYSAISNIYYETLEENIANVSLQLFSNSHDIKEAIEEINRVVGDQQEQFDMFNITQLNIFGEIIEETKEEIKKFNTDFLGRLINNLNNIPIMKMQIENIMHDLKSCCRSGM